MADHTYFSNLIWSIADLLRGLYCPPQCERVKRRTALIVAAVTGLVDMGAVA